MFCPRSFSQTVISRIFQRIYKKVLKKDEYQKFKLSLRTAEKGEAGETEVCWW
jgi:predicted RNA-binding protein with RPS1 domain